MDNNLIKTEILSDNIANTERVTREDVHARARELALIDGLMPPEVSQADYEQAKRELTGQSELDRQEAVLDSLPEERRNDPEPDSSGIQVLESSNEDEDDEGRSESEQLAEKGVEDAEREQVLQAALAAGKEDKRARRV